MEFTPYGKTNRLFREIIVTEKLDGTNCCIGIDDDGTVYAGSRTKWLTDETDHFGFYKWVMENQDSLKRDLGKGLHRGEWFGHRIQRKYGMDHKEFALFNTDKWGKVEFETPNLRTVPVLYQGVFNQWPIASALQSLKEHGSVASPGFMNPEGICVFHTQANIVFKVTVENDEVSKFEAAQK